ncbi:MAG: hypothetical protein ACRYGP_08045 [Janthinobacterium lividum]
MRRAGGIALAALVAGTPAGAAPLRAGPRMVPHPVFRPHPPFRIGPRLELRRWRYGFRPFARRPWLPNVPPLLLPSPPPDTFIQPEGPGASPLIEGAPEDLPSLAHGFHLDVKVGAGQAFAAPPTLNRFVEVGQALGRCFAVPAGLTWGSITLRVSLKRDGTVFGLPRVPYSDAATPDQKTELARSLLAGLKSCTPLPLSPSLGGAVAGEIFAIRFIHEDKR